MLTMETTLKKGDIISSFFDPVNYQPSDVEATYFQNVMRDNSLPFYTLREKDCVYLCGFDEDGIYQSLTVLVTENDGTHIKCAIKDDNDIHNLYHLGNIILKNESNSSSFPSVFVLKYVIENENSRFERNTTITGFFTTNESCKIEMNSLMNKKMGVFKGKQINLQSILLMTGIIVLGLMFSLILSISEFKFDFANITFILMICTLCIMLMRLIFKQKTVK